SPSRTGTLTVAGQTFTVTQANGCTYSINPTLIDNFNKNGGTTSAIAVTTGAGCTWTATPVDSWITIATGASGTGSGSVTLNVGSNSGNARSGTVTIAGVTFTLNQAHH